MLRRSRPLFVPLALLCLCPSLRADDWPQWLGPQRDGVWRERGLLDAIPKDGLKVRWRAPVSMGYAGPAVAGGKVFVMDRVPKEGTKAPADPFAREGKGLPGTERVLSFDAATGKQFWAFAYDCPYTISYAGGPRVTPAVDGDRVYALGAEGHLHCLDAATGRKIWGKRVFAGETPMWGYAAHPLVDGDLVYVTAPDPKGILLAFNKLTGDLAWQAIPAKECGYSPPVIRTSGGKRQLIQWYPAGITSLDPATGQVYWTVPQEPMEYGVTTVTPQLLPDPAGDLLFVASQYGGSVMIRLGTDPAGKPTGTLVYHRVGKKGARATDAIQTLMATPVLRGGHVYGLDARGQLRALVAATGDRLWETQAVTTYDQPPVQWANTFLTPLGDAGGRTLFANEHGDLVLGDLSPAGFKELGKAHLLDPTNTDAQRPVLWVHPAFAGRLIYWRNDKELVCWSFAKE